MKHQKQSLSETLCHFMLPGLPEDTKHTLSSGTVYACILLGRWIKTDSSGVFPSHRICYSLLSCPLVMNIPVRGSDDMGRYDQLHTMLFILSFLLHLLQCIPRSSLALALRFGESDKTGSFWECQQCSYSWRQTYYLPHACQYTIEEVYPWNYICFLKAGHRWFAVFLAYYGWKSCKVNLDSSAHLSKRTLLHWSSSNCPSLRNEGNWTGKTNRWSVGSIK